MYLDPRVEQMTPDSVPEVDKSCNDESVVDSVKDLTDMDSNTEG